MDSQDDAMGMYTGLLGQRVVVDEVWDDTKNYSPFGEQSMQNELGTPPVRPNNKRTRNFTNEEDQVLISAWLHASLDPIVRNEQKNATYWKRIHEEYELRKPEGSDRNISSLTHRWSAVEEQVGRFCGCFEQIMNRNASGKTEHDKACSLYKATDRTKRSFSLLHCWSLLRFNKKWLAQIDRSSQGNKKQKSRSNASPSMSRSDTTHIDDSGATSRAKADHLRRPIGKKAEKERQRRGKNVSSTDDSSVVMALDRVFSKRIEVEKAREMSREMARQSRELAREAGKKERYAGVLAIEQRMVEMREVSQEMETMNKDLSSMDEHQQEYYKMLRCDIIARRSKRLI